MLAMVHLFGHEPLFYLPPLLQSDDTRLPLSGLFLLIPQSRRWALLHFSIGRLLLDEKESERSIIRYWTPTIQNAATIQNCQSTMVGIHFPIIRNQMVWWPTTSTRAVGYYMKRGKCYLAFIFLIWVPWWWSPLVRLDHSIAKHNVH